MSNRIIAHLEEVPFGDDSQRNGKPSRDLQCPCNRGYVVFQGDRKCLKCQLEEKEKAENRNPPIERFTAGKLIKQYPKLKPAVIDGLIREGETGNIISLSKYGKTWLTYGLAFSVINGTHWLDKFATSRGRVLIIDNELHRETIAGRLKTVADAMGLMSKDYADALEVWPLRGNLRDIVDIGLELDGVKPGDFKLILFDAKYRMIPDGTSENDNASEARFYSYLDRYAEQTGAANLCIHHASKGMQSDKRVTDVGAGAGAQSRAADAHIILREHEDENVAVLEAAVRSFAPVEPLSLRWAFPLWVRDEFADPAKLKRQKTQQQQQQEELDREGMERILEALKDKGRSTNQLRTLTGMGVPRINKLVAMLMKDKKVTTEEVIVGGNVCDEFRLC